MLARIYWAFVGNRYARWRGAAADHRAQRREPAPHARATTLLRREPPRGNGHNPLAGISYMGLCIGFWLSILTGLGLFAWVIDRPAVDDAVRLDLVA